MAAAPAEAKVAAAAAAMKGEVTAVTIVAAEAAPRVSLEAQDSATATEEATEPGSAAEIQENCTRSVLLWRHSDLSPVG